ncbi:MAG: hypothetical protein QG611_686 [Bacteroidota bacterium]|nr:hypothetical protein [Bacteroidota bacterium]
MSITAHRIYIGIFVSIVFTSLILLIYNGLPYYNSGIEERVFHSGHNMLKPSGTIGHGLGIIGSLSIIIGVSTYMARKRYRSLSRLGLLKYWLEFHIFLCTLGPVLILFHTSFKFGGLVAVSFWSMVAVFLSGIIGRFIYIQIPRSIEGRALTLNEVREMRGDLAGILKNSYNLDEESYNTILNSVKKRAGLYYSNHVIRYFRNRSEDRKIIRSVKESLIKNKMPKVEFKKLLALVEQEITLNLRIERLDTMQNLFKYWHVVHLPFAIIMLIIMVIHVGVTILFGYRWIF